MIAIRLPDASATTSASPHAGIRALDLVRVIGRTANAPPDAS